MIEGERVVGLSNLFARRDPTGWRPDGFLEAIELLRTDYPLGAYDAAMDAAHVPVDERGAVKARIRNSLSDLAIFQHFEMKPGSTHFRDEIAALLATANALLSLHRNLSEPSQAAIRGTVNTSEPEERWLAEGLPIPEGRLDGALLVVSQLANWYQQALAAIPEASRGQPRKEALFLWGVRAARIFSETTGRRPTRRVANVSVSQHQQQALETGSFRDFANIILAPLGLALSDGMAKRVISATQDD